MAKMDYANFEVNLSLDNAADDYFTIVDNTMKVDLILPIDVQNACWNKISLAARETIWKLLFDEDNEQHRERRLKEAAELLKHHKEDACFYEANEYNKWIVLVRDELLKREMFDFWKDEIVENELGPCWARDSDLFDDPYDPEPANFYNHAGCMAKWLKIRGQHINAGDPDNKLAWAVSETVTPEGGEALKKMSKETPLADYKYNMATQAVIGADDDDAYKKIFKETREMIWDLLFSDPPYSEEIDKAGRLLEAYKRDACFYSPWDYNDWIPKLKEELLKRRYLDFWQEVVVKKELGLCWARDSDYFDDMDDPKPLEFYKVTEEEMLKKA